MPNQVRFLGGQAWRASAFGSPAVGQVVGGEGAIATGDGGSEPIFLRVTSRSVVNDYFTAEFVGPDGSPGIVHTYAAPNAPGSPYVASFSSCCRISPHSSGNFHVNNPDQSERLETLVDLTGARNSAPRSSLPPINSCPRDAVCTLPIPVVDPEAQPVTYRLATSAEAGDGRYVPPGPPHATYAATVHPTSGVLTWDTRGATVSADATEHTLYSVQVVLSDGRAKTPLDFFLEIVPPDVRPPVWDEPPTPCGDTLVLGAGAPFSFDARARSPDGRAVYLGTLGLPAGASMPLPTPANPAGATFSWTPATTQAGTYLLILTAEDDRGYAAPACAVTLVVTLRPVAEAGPDVCAVFGSTITLDGRASHYAGGTIVTYRWDFPHGTTPLYGAVVTRTLSDPADLEPHAATLTILTNDSQIAVDVVGIRAFDRLDVTSATDRERYTPFQRPSGVATAQTPCGAPIAGTLMDVTVAYTTNDTRLDALLEDLLGPDALMWRTLAPVDAAGRFAWTMPFTVAERYALPFGLLNPMSQLLALQGDYVVTAHATLGTVEGMATSRFDVVIDPQFPLDELP